MNIQKFCSTSQMFVYLNVPSFGKILRRNIYSFIMRLNNSLNCFIRASLFFVISHGFQYVELAENSVVLNTIMYV